MIKSYAFKEKVWVFDGPAAWYFITLPKDVAANIDFYFSNVKRGWGSLPVNVAIGKTKWKTSIFTDKKSKSYMLPLKSEVRKEELIKSGDIVSINLEVES